MDVLGVVPVRSGSKRVPNKNVRELGGKPLLAHTIEQAASSSVLDRCLISTDDEEIATVAREHGGDAPFLRPDRLATDTASSADAVAHALEWVHERGHEPTIVVLLQVTTPFRTSADIDEAVEKLRRSPEAKSIVAVTEYRVPPQWAFEIDDEGRLRSHFSAYDMWDDGPGRSQETATLYHPNGAVFAARVDSFLADPEFYKQPTISYEMPAERSLDIDEPYDLELARALYEYRNKN
ncbi:cytidylyltransferase domain-containing protein [Haloplanus litoreus]|uniref:Cytidylyltransferase domain-containing protein n=1 Tax=Haloplanus litoreus TaxID=767515 RepID=A0ABD5ZX67_9EURY